MFSSVFLRKTQTPKADFPISFIMSVSLVKSLNVKIWGTDEHSHMPDPSTQW